MRATATLQTGIKNPVSAAPLPKDTEKAPVQATESQDTLVAGPGHNFGSIKVHSGHSLSASPIRIQPKLTINQPGDVYEQEADAVADRAMRMPDAPPKLSGKVGSTIQRKCAKCEKEEKSIQRKETGGLGGVPAATASYVSGLSGGQPLNAGERSFFEPRIGQDLSRVQLHTDSRAAESAHGINALAYTHGNHIVFGAGQYQSESESSRRLMAHELVHTVQQGNNPTGILQREPATDETDSPKRVVSPEKTSERAEYAYRQAGMIEEANAVQNCREKGICDKLLTEAEAWDMYGAGRTTAKLGPPPEKSSALGGVTGTTVAMGSVAVLPAVAPWVGGAAAGTSAAAAGNGAGGVPVDRHARPLADRADWDA